LPKNDEGEFELVLGNKQLITVFAIVVVLLGVFFSMGYVVGRNSSLAGTETARNEKPKPDSADSSNSDTPPDEATTPPGLDSTASADQAQTSQSAPPESTKPAQSPAPAPSKPEPARPKEVKPKPSPAPAPTAPVHANAAGEPAGGQYWQVVATARPDAEIIAEALGKKGFHVVLAPTPNKDGVFRVLVGPLPDAPTQASTRTGLESAGFKNPIMRKY
jgi:cell division septation protein DedD